MEIPAENLFLSIQLAAVNTLKPGPGEETIVIEGTVEADGNITGSSILKTGNPVAGVSFVDIIFHAFTPTFNYWLGVEALF